MFAMRYFPPSFDWFFFANGMIFAGLLLAASIVYLMYVDGYFTKERAEKRKQEDSK